MIPFNDTTNKSGLIQHCEEFTGLGDGGISGNTTRLKRFTALINHWLGNVTTDILSADGKMQWDDSNYTDRPVATFDLVAGQGEYSFTVDDNGSQILKLERVEVKDASSGNFLKLNPIDQGDITGAIDEYMNVSGIPTRFDATDTTIKVFPPPSYNSTAGGKLYFQREASFFISTDTTKTPGFASPFHLILALGPSADWGMGKEKSNSQVLRSEAERLREDLKTFYSNRAKYEKTKLVPKFRRIG